MSVTWRKVWRDLAHNKARSLLVVLSIAVGVFALGMLFGAHDVMGERLTENHLASIPIHITLWGWFGPAEENAVLREPGVADVERLVDTSIRWKLDGETDWRDGDLVARADYEAQHMGLVELVHGEWPSHSPANRTLAVERMSSRYFNIPLGTEIIVQFGQRERRLPVVGIVRDTNFDPPQFGGDAAFFATPETATWLTGDVLNRLDVRMAPHSSEDASELVERIRDRLEGMGSPAGGFWIRDPTEHWVQETVDTSFVILTVLGALSLGMSAFLIINTMNAIIAQQVQQIGVMKAIGATFGRIVRVYLTTALLYGALALSLAVPLGAVGAHLLAAWVLDMFNITLTNLRIVPLAVGIQTAVGLIVPLSAALVPVVGGARITTHQAISSYGLRGKFGRGWLDRLVGRVRRLPRPTALSLRNTFRRKARVALTLITLALSGMMFMMVMSVETSFDNTIELLVSDFGFDVMAGLDRLYRVERLLEVTESVPGVVKAEVWGRWGTRLKLDDNDSRYIGLWSVPPDSEILHPRIISGRGLQPDDGNAILLNHKIAVDEGIQVGDPVKFDLGGKETVWTVVGLVVNARNGQTDCFVPFDTLARETGRFGQGHLVLVVSEQHDPESQQQMIGELGNAYSAHHLEVTWFESTTEEQKSMREQFDILLYLLLTMALLAAVVGGIGLASTMSINVIERGREIGVMRAIGATSPAIAGIFVVEGMLIGLLSWLFAVPLSYPGSRLFSNAVGETLLEVPFDFEYSLGGVLLWLGIVLTLSAQASLWPALRATRVSVREALAYE
jgi:putative ABC transport system permease protein